MFFWRNQTFKTPVDHFLSRWSSKSPPHSHFDQTFPRRHLPSNVSPRAAFDLFETLLQCSAATHSSNGKTDALTSVITILRVARKVMKVTMDTDVILAMIKMFLKWWSHSQKGEVSRWLEWSQRILSFLWNQAKEDKAGFHIKATLRQLTLGLRVECFFAVVKGALTTRIGYLQSKSKLQAMIKQI